MTMSEYLDARSYGTRSNGNGKEMYTVNLNKHFRKLELSSYINFSREPIGTGQLQTAITLPYHIILI